LTADAGDNVVRISTASNTAIHTFEVLGAYDISSQDAGRIEGVGDRAYIMGYRIDVVVGRNNSNPNFDDPKSET
jgi:hypothetical protein